MTPDFCANCAKVDAPCATGMADSSGRRCPRFEHACQTFEGAAVWDAISRAGGWTGGGMTPRRLDRSAIRARLAEVPGWIVEELCDAAEPAALAAEAKAREREKKARTSAVQRRGARRAHTARREDQDD
ncbi:MAG: hypothetical protein K2X61_03870 [Caulobacteraceae bacterium]|nr:hypothetical protein [Caulobacteraceae bacterium]